MRITETVAHKKAEALNQKSGQSGSPLKLNFSDLTGNEKRVLFAIPDARVVSIRQIADIAFPALDATKSHSWARNQLRRLVRGGLVERKEEGQYALSKVGRRMKVTVLQ